MARLVGRNLDAQADGRRPWKGRRVRLFDGSTASMPDTAANRREYPPAYNRAPGTSFAPARIGAIVSPSCGAILDPGICRYAGEGQGEVSPLRRPWDVLRPGDVLPWGRLMSGRAGMHVLEQRGVDAASRLRAHRRADSRVGTRPGKDDHPALREEPASIRPVGRPADHAPPGSIAVREARFRVEQAGFRARSIAVVTALPDPAEASREELAAPYRARWDNEPDPRPIEVTPQLDRPRCKAPGLVREETWAHAPAYNLIRTATAQAAARAGAPPRSISLKAAPQVQGAFRTRISADAQTSEQDLVLRQA